MQNNLLTVLTTRDPEVPQNDQQSPLLQHVAVGYHSNHQQMKKIIREKDRVRRDEGISNGGEKKRQRFDVLLVQQVKGVGTGQVHGTRVIGQELGKGWRSVAWSVVLLQLPVDASEEIVHHHCHQIRTELHHQTYILPTTHVTGV